MHCTVSEASTNELPQAQEEQAATDTLDVCVLGVHCGNDLSKLSCALVRYSTHLNGPLCVELSNVSRQSLKEVHLLTIYVRLAQLRYPNSHGTKSWLPCTSLEASLP
jgi:hypothetical protein